MIFATFYQVAISDGKCGDGNGGGGDLDWSAGKREAQRLFKQYITGFLELKSAAHKVLGTGTMLRFLIRNRKKSKEIMGCFIDLSATVFYLPPLFLLNDEHPSFPKLEQAAQKVCTDSHTMLPYNASHIF